MEEFEQQKLDTALIYLQRLSDGRNPTNNQPIQEDTVLNNPNVIRCLFFVKEVLEAVQRNKYCVGAKRSASSAPDLRQPFPLEALQSFVYEEERSITRFVQQLNAPVDQSVYQPIKYSVITNWLKENGFLENILHPRFHKRVNVPTERGESIGIRTEMRNNAQGISYQQLLYGRDAQLYIVQNLPEILANAEAPAAQATE